MKTIGITGHRPTRLISHPYCYGRPLLDLLTAIAREQFIEHQPSTVVSGAALGWDTACVQAALNLGIHVLAAVPFESQDSLWPAETKRRYRQMLEQCEVVIVSPGGYTLEKMYKRNDFIVQASDSILALWDGEPKGGTAKTVESAKAQGRSIINVWSTYMERRPSLYKSITREPLEYYLDHKYPIVLYPDSNKGYTVRIKDLPGCITQGDTLEKSIVAIEDARVAWITAAYERGDIIPLPYIDI